MKIEFDHFVVDDGGILIQGYYRVAAEDLWNFREFKGVLVWDWLIHLTEKDFVRPENYTFLNTAFFFAQSFFEKYKPVNLPLISTHETLYIQKQIMQQRSEVINSKTLKAGIDTIFNRKDIEQLGLNPK